MVLNDLEKRILIKLSETMLESAVSVFDRQTRWVLSGQQDVADLLQPQRDAFSRVGSLLVWFATADVVVDEEEGKEELG
jgi:hypothetical protein